MKEVKEMLNEFSSLFADSLCIICIFLSGFLILINIYHYQEISYKINNEYINSEEYKANKNNIMILKEKINNISDNKVSQSDYFIFSQTKIKLNACLETLENSSFYTMNIDKIGLLDLYNFNNELTNNLQYKCLFEIDYTISNGIEEYNSSLDYDLTEEVENVRNDIMFYGDYLKNQLLANGSYYYSTENSKVSIYNDTLSYYNLITHNYNKLANETDKLANWFLEEFGR